MFASCMLGRRSKKKQMIIPKPGKDLQKSMQNSPDVAIIHPTKAQKERNTEKDQSGSMLPTVCIKVPEDEAGVRPSAVVIQVEDDDGERSPPKVSSPQGLSERRRRSLAVKVCDEPVDAPAVETLESPAVSQWDMESPCHPMTCSSQPSMAATPSTVARTIDACLTGTPHIPPSGRVRTANGLPRSNSDIRVLRRAPSHVSIPDSEQWEAVSMVAIVPLDDPEPLATCTAADGHAAEDVDHSGSHLKWMVPWLLEGAQPRRPSLLDVAMVQKQWEDMLLFSEVEPSYQGPHLNFPLGCKDLVALFQHFLHNPTIPLHPKYVLQILNHSEALLHQMPKVAELTLLDNMHRQMVVVGELQGHLQDLLHIFQQYGSPHLPGGSLYLIIGDCTGVGNQAVETMLLILAFKLVYPHSVYWVGGNMDKSDCLSHGEPFEKELLQKYRSEYMHRKFQAVRNSLPVAAIFEGQIIAVHWDLFRPNSVPLEVITGQIPDPGSMKPRAQWEVIISEFLWGADGQFPSPVRYTPKATPEQISQIRMVISAHSSPRTDRGYEITHSGKLVVLLSASNGFNQSNRPGAVLIFTPGSLAEFTLQEHLVWNPQDLAMLQAAYSPVVRLHEIRKWSKSEMIAYIRRQCAIHQSDIEWLLRIHEIAPSIVPVATWRFVLTTVLGLTLHWEEYEADLIGEMPLPVVNYSNFLQQCTTVPQADTWHRDAVKTLHDALCAANFKLEDMVRLFDRKGNGEVTADVLNEILMALGVKLRPEQLEALLWDAVCSHHVDVMSFLDSLRIRPKTEDLKADIVDVAIGVCELLTVADPFWDTLTLFKLMDVDNQGRIPLSNFVDTMRGLINSHGPELISRRAPLQASALSPRVAPGQSALLAAQLSPRNPAHSPRRSLRPSAHPMRIEEISDVVLHKLAFAMAPKMQGAINYMHFADIMGRPRCGAARLLERLCHHVYTCNAEDRLNFRSTELDGTFTFEEVKQWLRKCASLADEPEAVLDHLLCFMDVDCDGRISFKDFCSAFYFADLECTGKEHIARHELHFSHPESKPEFIGQGMPVDQETVNQLLTKLQQSYQALRNSHSGATTPS